ncbi:hypothetical protein GLYMA_15G056400v4 [Glycine max]|nr:hypothetical protein GLYMA_15G056400v4 [Glycine max]KAH1145740.1 hypothetical protein GYH30_041449 [Glycine max]
MGFPFTLIQMRCQGSMFYSDTYQNMLSRDTTVIAETGDTWFTCQKLKLPHGCGYECQMQYGSIGWSVGATLGYAQAAPHKRVIASRRQYRKCQQCYGVGRMALSF